MRSSLLKLLCIIICVSFFSASSVCAAGAKAAAQKKESVFLFRNFEHVRKLKQKELADCFSRCFCPLQSTSFATINDFLKLCFFCLPQEANLFNYLVVSGININFSKYAISQLKDRMWVLVLCLSCAQELRICLMQINRKVPLGQYSFPVIYAAETMLNVYLESLNFFLMGLKDLIKRDLITTQRDYDYVSGLLLNLQFLTACDTEQSIIQEKNKIFTNPMHNAGCALLFTFLRIALKTLSSELEEHVKDRALEPLPSLAVV